MKWILSCLLPPIAFGSAALFAFLTVPLARRCACYLGVIDIPLDRRRMHRQPVPRLGGLALVCGFAAAAAWISLLTPHASLRGLAAGSALILPLGILDDRFRLPAAVKLPVQLAAAIFPALLGCGVSAFSLGRITLHPGKLLAFLLSVLWLTALTNAMNFIDGLDGLSCGSAAISSLALLIFAALRGDLQNAALCAALAGVCIGFLPYNRTPARIFMGDTGATFLGFALGTLSMEVFWSGGGTVPLYRPLLLFLLPLSDLAFAVLRRTVTGVPPWKADRGHIHHRLIDRGLSARKTVRLLWCVTAVGAMLALLPLPLSR